ncbi:MAG: hypothetical protein AAFX56_04600 [Pseudomonadota bacterium]
MSAESQSDTPNPYIGWLLACLLLAVIATLIALYTQAFIGSFEELFSGFESLPLIVRTALRYAALAPYLSVAAYAPALMLYLQRKEKDSGRRWTLIAFFTVVAFTVLLLASGLAMYLPMFTAT